MPIVVNHFSFNIIFNPNDLKPLSQKMFFGEFYMGVIEENLFIFHHILLGFMKFLDELLDRLNAMWN